MQFVAYCVDPNQLSHSMAADLSLHCLQLSLKSCSNIDVDVKPCEKETSQMKHRQQHVQIFD